VGPWEFDHQVANSTHRPGVPAGGPVQLGQPDRAIAGIHLEWFKARTAEGIPRSTPTEPGRCVPLRYRALHRHGGAALRTPDVGVAGIRAVGRALTSPARRA